jgi:serine/threonine protein kinase
MEKALLRDLGAMINHLHQHNFIKLINNPFLELIGNNLLKYFVKQIVQGMETLDKNELVHFDIKPENILIQSGLVLKVTDFSFLMNLQDNENEKSIKIPGGTKGYVTPEYYQKKEIDKLTAKKQDYFALGATIYLLKVGYQMLKYKKYENDTLTEDRIIDLLQRDVAHIRADPLMDKDFVDFLCQLIQYIPEERPSFEEIYRNKWLNKDSDEISFIINSFIEGEESVLMKELIKSDYLIKKQAEIKKEENRKNFTFID